jgi:hypothetical protein
MTSARGRYSALLVIACSRRKTPGIRRARAWDLYDGRVFQVLKKALREQEGWEERIHVLIISARYGILRPDRVINTYDERITPTLVRERGGRWTEGLREAVAGHRYRAVHVNLGRAYCRALPDLRQLFPEAEIDWATGGIGARNAQTRGWVLEQLDGD